MAPSEPQSRCGSRAAARRHDLRPGARRSSPGGHRSAGGAQLGQGRILAAHPGCGPKGIRSRKDLHLHARSQRPETKPPAEEVALARCLTVPAFSPASLKAVADWPAIEREVIDGFFRFSPTHARYMGDHRFDGVVGDASKTAIRARVAE